MKILFKILVLPLFIPYIFVVGTCGFIIGQGDAVDDFVDWYTS